ncbi:MAG: heavy-metal-associated domain-containing protein [Candidatus Babeliales bacterium]
MKKSIFLMIIITVCCISYAGPYTKKRSEKSDQQKISTLLRKKKNASLFYVKVSGVECELCAESVLTALKKINGIEEPLFKNVTEDYEQSYIELFWTKRNENISFESLKKAVEKEGFELVSLEGTFHGSMHPVDGQTNSVHFHLDSSKDSFLVEPLPKVAQQKKLSLKGKLAYDEKHKQFVFSMS